MYIQRIMFPEIALYIIYAHYMYYNIMFNCMYYYNTGLVQLIMIIVLRFEFEQLLHVYIHVSM